MILRRVLRITTTSTARTTTISHFTKPFLLLPITRTYKACTSPSNQRAIRPKFNPTLFNTNINILASRRYFSTSNKEGEGETSEDPKKKGENEQAQGLDVDTDTPSDFVLENKEKVRTDFSSESSGGRVHPDVESISTGSHQSLSFDDGGTMSRLESQLYGFLFLTSGILLSMALIDWWFRSTPMMFDYNAMMSQAVEFVAITTVNLPAIKKQLGPVTVDAAFISAFTSDNYCIILYPLIIEKKNARGGTVYIDLVKKNGTWKFGSVSIDLVNGSHATLPKFEEYFWGKNKFTTMNEIRKEIVESDKAEQKTLELSLAPPTETEELKRVEKKKAYRLF